MLCYTYISPVETIRAAVGINSTPTRNFERERGRRERERESNSHQLYTTSLSLPFRQPHLLSDTREIFYQIQRPRFSRIPIPHFIPPFISPFSLSFLFYFLLSILIPFSLPKLAPNLEREAAPTSDPNPSPPTSNFHPLRSLLHSSFSSFPFCIFILLFRAENSRRGLFSKRGWYSVTGAGSESIDFFRKVNELKIFFLIEI